MNQYLLVAGLLGELTAELQRLERWQAEHPGEEALASTLSFCVDTLSFDQWLQFVLIQRMEQLARQGRNPLRHADDPESHRRSPYLFGASPRPSHLQRAAACARSGDYPRTDRSLYPTSGAQEVSGSGAGLGTRAGEVIDYPLKEQLDKIADAMSNPGRSAQDAVTTFRRLHQVELPHAVSKKHPTRALLLKLEAG